MLPLVLASTSPFRRDLLSRLQVPFETVAPDADETPLADELPTQTAERLAVAKAKAVATRYPAALIIGSDQVAFCGEQRFGKPGARSIAMQQLRAMSGKEVVFHTGLCLYNSQTGRIHLQGIQNIVGFRELKDVSEGLGISLLRYLRGDDPNALVGLPLIALCEMLRAEGVALP